MTDDKAAPTLDEVAGWPATVGLPAAGRRADRGLSQAEVARLMGTTQSAVSDLERGLTEPQLDTLQRFARAVGCVLEVRVR